jgi:hypothetical protein
MIFILVSFCDRRRLRSRLMASQLVAPARRQIVVFYQFVEITHMVAAMRCPDDPARY